MNTWLRKKVLDVAYGKPVSPEGGFDPSRIRKILLIRRNGLGDMICTLPLIRNLRAAMPDVQLDILAGERNACVIENLGLVNRIHLYRRGKGILRNHYLNLPTLLAPIHRESYDLLIAVKGGFSPLLAVIARATRIPWRLGYVPSRGHALDFCFNLKVELPVEREHQIESCLRFLKCLKLSKTTCDLSIRLEKGIQTRMMNRLKQLQLGVNQYAVISVSSDRYESRWTEQGILETSKYLHLKFGLPVVLVGLKRDRLLMEQLMQQSSGSVVAVDDPASFQDFAAWIAGAKLLLCGDGGPMHIAASVGTPVFVLFSATDPDIWRPYHVPFEFIQVSRLVSDIQPEAVIQKMETWVPRLPLDRDSLLKDR